MLRIADLDGIDFEGNLTTMYRPQDTDKLIKIVTKSWWRSSTNYW